MPKIKNEPILKPWKRIAGIGENKPTLNLPRYQVCYQKMKKKEGIGEKRSDPRS